MLFCKSFYEHHKVLKLPPLLSVVQPEGYTCNPPRFLTITNYILTYTLCQYIVYISSTPNGRPILLHKKMPFPADLYIHTNGLYVISYVPEPIGTK